MYKPLKKIAREKGKINQSIPRKNKKKIELIKKLKWKGILGIGRMAIPHLTCDPSPHIRKLRWSLEGKKRIKGRGERE